MTRLGVFVVSWNRLPFLTRTLESLLAVLDVPARVTVIDNASEPETRQWLQRFGRCVVHQLEENRWVNGAHAAAWPADLTTAYQYVLCCDNDVEFLIPLSVDCRFLDGHRDCDALSLQHSPEHDTLEEVAWSQYRIARKRAERGTAVIYRAGFLQANRPLPTHKRLDFDWWLFRDGPESIARRGGLVSVLIGAARHLAWRPGDSTWQPVEIPEFDEFKRPIKEVL